jgi:hypothetical protein
MCGMFGLMRRILGRVSYRRRWGRLAAAAAAAADSATRDLDRRERSRQSRRVDRAAHRPEARHADPGSRRAAADD